MRIAAAALALAGAACAVAAAEAASVSMKPYGRLADGRAVEQVTLENDQGMVVKLIGYGAIITDVIVPDRKGKRDNVALGFSRLRDYETRNQDAFGAVIGRYAGRIAGARFAIEGREVRLQANDGPNTLHGGPGGFDKRLWAVSTFRKGENVGAVLRYSSPEGEQNFSGRLDVSITYTL